MKKIKKEYYFIAILLVCFTILTLFVVGNKTNYIDEFVYNNIIKLKSELLTSILYVITNIGSTFGTFCVVTLVCIIFFKNKNLSDLKYVISNVGIGVLLMQSLKHIIKRIRPAWKWIVQGGFSYPSGHTISCVVLYGTLILLVSKRVKGKFKTPLIIFFSLMIFLISVSRIYFCVHYVTDVVAILILGSVILIISNIFIEREIDNDKNKDRKNI